MTYEEREKLLVELKELSATRSKMVAAFIGNGVREVDEALGTRLSRIIEAVEGWQWPALAPAVPAHAGPLKCCPFCGVQMEVGRVLAFHPPWSDENSCWVATADEMGGPLLLESDDYHLWNKRAVDLADATLSGDPPDHHSAATQEITDGARPHRDRPKLKP